MTPNCCARLVGRRAAVIVLATILIPAGVSAGPVTETMTVPGVCSGVVPILSFELGAKDAIAVVAGARGGRVEVSDVSVVKPTDACSPKLFLAAVMATPIPAVTIQASSNQVNVTIELSQVIISSIQLTGSQGVDRPTEVVTFNYAKMTLTIEGNKVVIVNPLVPF